MTKSEEPAHIQVGKRIIIPVIKDEITNFVPPTMETKNTISKYSITSINKVKELEANQIAHQKEIAAAPDEAFTFEQMFDLWQKFAEKLSNSGQKIMATYMLMNEPELDGSTIKLELPNEGSKVDFEMNQYDLLVHLRNRLKNQAIKIDIHVNEITQLKHAFTPAEKFDKLKNINPSLELMKKMFDLDV